MIEVKLFQGDCLEIMKTIPNDSIDLTVTSPPYDNLRTYNGNIKQWSFEKFQKIAKELYRITKDGGVIVWVVGDATIKGSETGTSFKQALWFKECGFNLHDTMIYQKENYVPQVVVRYGQAFEYMFVFSKGKPKTFNPLMEKCKYGGVPTWGSSKYYKSNGDETAAINNRVINENKPHSNIFSYRVGSTGLGDKSKSHPAPFPLQLVEDAILSWSNEGGLIADILMGSGTTGIACKIHNRNFIGIEIDEDYFKSAKSRIEKYER